MQANVTLHPSLYDWRCRCWDPLLAACLCSECCLANRVSSRKDAHPGIGDAPQYMKSLAIKSHTYRSHVTTSHSVQSDDTAGSRQSMAGRSCSTLQVDHQGRQMV